MEFWRTFQCLQTLELYHQEISKWYRKPTSNGFICKGKTESTFPQAIQLQMGRSEIFI